MMMILRMKGKIFLLVERNRKFSRIGCTRMATTHCGSLIHASLCYKVGLLSKILAIPVKRPISSKIFLSVLPSTYYGSTYPPLKSSVERY